LDKNYLAHVEDIEYFPDTMKALLLFQQLGYELFVVTNQSGVGRGYFSMESVYVIHRQLQNDLRTHKLNPFKDFAICPHSPEDKCDCRKPSGHMIQELITKHHVDPKNSYMLGDKVIDAEAGRNAGITGILVRHEHQTDYPFYKTLLEFAQHLKKSADA
jgi:UDP-N-acetylmuramoyl-tripeptide--D-alanyl-D-alanine ligase